MMRAFSRRDFMKGMLAGGVAVGSAGLLTACGSSSSESSSSDSSSESTGSSSGETSTGETSTGSNGRTKVAVGCKNAIQSLSPFQGPNPYTDAILGQIYQWLAIRESVSTSEMTGMLAKSWSTEDGQTYSFELYEGICDTEGNPFTSSDVAFCIEQHVAGGTAAAGYVDSINVIDDTHFEMVLTTNAVGTLEQVCENCLMTTQAAYEASSDGMATTPVGTNQYKLQSYTAGANVIIEKADSFWMTDEGYDVPKLCEANVDVIEYDFLTETTQLNLALLQDSVQMAIQIDTSQVEDLSAEPNYDVEKSPIGMFRLLVFNCTEDSPLNNQALREAVCYAIDSEGLNVGVLSGLGSVPGGLGNEAYIGFNEDWWSDDYYSYNPELAKEKLAEAGYAEGEVTLRAAINSLASVKSYFEMISTYLQAVGINLVVDQYENNVYGEKQLTVTAGEWDMCIGYSITSIYQANQFAAINDASIYAHGMTQYGVDDPYLQELMQDCLSPDWTQDELDELESIIADNCYYYAFINEEYYHCVNVGISDVVYNGKGRMLVAACTFADDWSYFE